MDLMLLSHYLKIYPCEDKPDHHLVFSTKNASKILINKQTLQDVEKGTISPADEKILSKLGMIVQDRETEKQAAPGFFDKINSSNPALHIFAVLNLDCNFSCRYCYEGDMKGKLYMSDSTAECLIDFIKNRFTQDKSSLLIDFYGGEPLLSFGLIKSISHDLKSFTESRKASFSSTLVTNGSLFKKKIAEELVSLGLESIKITLDGPADTHNMSRPFKSGAGSFDTIINNIKETCDIVKIGIGGNYEKDNHKKFPLLLDYLLEESLTPDKLFMIKFDPVIRQPEPGPYRSGYMGGCLSVNEPWIAKAEAMLREEILKRGYNTLNMGPASCMLEIKDDYVINFDGMIYKCPGFIGRTEFIAGDLKTGIKDYTDSYKLGIWKNEECADCEYLPLCFGGCRYMTFVRNGNIDKLDCKKSYFEASLETLVKQDIKYKLKADRH